jgi:apolipoprotein N-acyltransferase
VQVLLGWGLAQACRFPQDRRRWALLLALLLGLHGLGQAALASTGPDPGPQDQVRLLQPAIPTRHKFEARQQLRLLGLLASAQRQASALEPATLVLPEGALALGQSLPETAPVEVLSGGFRQANSGLHSSLLRFAPNQQHPSSWVDKHRVVPLGEWLPLAELWRWSGLSAVGGLQPGPAPRLLARPGGAIGVAICYELADGRALAQASREGARWLLASANLDPYPPLLQAQFSALARLRAIETGRWLVSAANTGPSLVVDAQGQLRHQLPPGPQLSPVLTVAQRQELSPYDRWGELPLLLLLASGLLIHRREALRSG